VESNGAGGADMTPSVCGACGLPEMLQGADAEKGAAVQVKLDDFMKGKALTFCPYSWDLHAIDTNAPILNGLVAILKEAPQLAINIHGEQIGVHSQISKDAKTGKTFEECFPGIENTVRPDAVARARALSTLNALKELGCTNRITVSHAVSNIKQITFQVRGVPAVVSTAANAVKVQGPFCQCSGELPAPRALFGVAGKRNYVATDPRGDVELFEGSDKASLLELLPLLLPLCSAVMLALVVLVVLVWLFLPGSPPVTPPPVRRTTPLLVAKSLMSPRVATNATVTVSSPGECGLGTYFDEKGSICVGCPSGKISTKRGGVSKASCSDCGPGTYSEYLTGSSTCIECAAGTFSEKFSGAGKCIKCPKVNLFLCACAKQAPERPKRRQMRRSREHARAEMSTLSLMWPLMTSARLNAKSKC